MEAKEAVTAADEWLNAAEATRRDRRGAGKALGIILVSLLVLFAHSTWGVLFVALAVGPAVLIATIVSGTISGLMFYSAQNLRRTSADPRVKRRAIVAIVLSGLALVVVISEALFFSAVCLPHC